MAVNLVVFPHTHKWRRWITYESGGWPVIDNEIQRYRRGHFAKVFKCWRCGLTSENGAEKRMKGYDELKAEHEAIIAVFNKGGTKE